MNLKSELKKYFGYDRFKRGQEELIEGILRGRDVLGIMPTGGGKSICYQLPSVIVEGITIVISPLISLMKDQVDSLNEIGIEAAFINSTLGNDELMEIIHDIQEGRYKIIYVAPERLKSSLFINLIRNMKVSLVAIDEAHCISQWGHDFRPSYLEIPIFIESFYQRPVVAAFTATATKEIIKEIKKLIGLKNPLEALTGFDRPNLYYQVIKASKKFKHLSTYLESNFPNESGIIYCATRKTVEAVVKKLEEKNYSVVGYHGGMKGDDRQRNQEDFILGRKRIIVATNAFGMGIDKPDVRFVIHYNMPKNMEAYYQEAGRAGRDGEESHCILMYSPADIVKQKLILENDNLSVERQELLYKNLQYLVDFCHTNDCLRGKILIYFGEELKDDNCGSCSNCLDESEMIDITIEAQKILSCIYRLNERYGANTVVQVLRASENRKVIEAGLNNLSTYGIMKDYNNHAIKEIIMTLVSKGYIYITADKYPVLKLTKESRSILKGDIKILHKKDLIHNSIDRNERKNKSGKDMDKDIDKTLLKKLKEYRYVLAKEKEVPPYIIFHDAALKEMATYFPQNEKTLLEIKGVGSKKYENYGQEFIELIKEYCKENEIQEVAIERESEARDEEKLENESKEDRYDQTYNCYLEGLSIEEMAKKRGFTTNTIINHLKNCEGNGKEIEWSKFIEDPIKEKKILDVVEKLGIDKWKPIKEALDEDVSYEDIKVVVSKYGLI